MELKYVPNFKVRNIENYFRNINILYDEGEMEGETKLNLILGGHSIALNIPEKIGTASFQFVVDNEKLKGFRLIEEKEGVITIKQDRIVSLEEVKLLITSLFSFLVGEGHREFIMNIVDTHQDLMVGLFSCLTEVYFLPSELVEYDNKFNKDVLMNKSDRVLDSLYSVVKR